MKKIIAMLLAVVLSAVSLCACGTTPSASSAASEAAAVMASAVEESSTAATGEKRSVGFVTFGLGGDFFQSLADAFVTKMEANGWEAQYTDGKFDPTAQIEAMENFIAMEVDVIVLWSVAPEAMDTVVKSAMDKGIKVIDFVAKTTEYDVLMVSDDAELADSLCKLAAKWIDATYASAADKSVPVAVLSCRTAATGVVQADRLIKIEEFSKKAKFVTEVECVDENLNTGMQTAENLYTSNPEIKVVLTAHNGLAMGTSKYFTAVGSPVTDYKDMGIFAINGDVASAEIIKTSIDNAAPFRGMVLTGSVEDTANEVFEMCTGIMDGTVEKGFIQKAGTMFVNADTVDEYIKTGTVTSLTAEDFK